MMDAALADAIREFVFSLMNSNTTKLPNPWLYAQWDSEEPTDTNLSVVRLPDGSTLRGVPKGESVGTLIQNDTILVAVPRSGPMVIIDRVLGNPAAFTV